MRLAAIGILGFSLLVSYQSFQTDKRHLAKLGSPLNLPIYISNFTGHPLPLFSAKIPYGNPIAQLPDNGYYQFLYAGNKKGDWLYGILNGQEVFLKDSSRHKIVLLSGYPIQLRYLYHTYTLGLFFFILILRLTPESRVTRKSLKDQLARTEEIANQEREARILEQNTRFELENVLSQRTQQVHKLMTEKKQHVQNEDRLKSEFKEKERVLRRQFEKEANEIEILAERNNKIKVSNMQAAYDRLNNLYQELKTDHQRLKAEGVVFDINFDSKNYENLLTGRLYEIFFAKSLLEDSNFEILHWTSDKGFEHGIKVKSNGDPDFLLRYSNDLVFAVECKYRSNYYAKQNPKKIEWGKTWQAERYMEFQLEKKIPVFIAMGLEGTADNPRHNYVIVLDYLKKNSDGLYWNNNKEKNTQQQVVLLSKVFDYYIRKKDIFPKKMMDLVIEQLDTN